jgi:UDP-N-acetylglucosamine 1-carboxyvinyltransferase
VDLHIEGVKALGASVDLDEGYVVARAKGGRLRGGYFKLEPSSVGATINLLLAAVLARGYSRLENAAIEPDVVVFGEVLKQMGARIEGLGTRVVEIYGVDSLDAVAFKNCPDRIELGTFMIMAALTGEPGSTIEITNGNPDHLGEQFIDAFGRSGAQAEYASDRVIVTPADSVLPVSVETAIYPGFPTDLQAQWTVLMAQADGNSRVRDTIYSDRFKHIPELRRLGINAIVIGNEVVIEGGSKVRGAKVMSTDLRASVSLVLAGLMAEGETEVLRIYHLDRGYENLEGKLASAGLKVERISYDEWAQPVPLED